ncbi:hypothetical protein GCM10009721_40110 [Terrabacter tumescens]|uniref:Uncharacterized protein n=1 Tax=Terrabacter tumescens TaxID=60443 RepID=A0ABQ2IG99_9MICO|nr:hypothetical protein GCM10009721_40110 [Terrabacter tumescens]
MRRRVAALLVVGSALLVAAVIWPTDTMVLQSADGAVVPLLDIWLWGRVRSVSELSSTDLDGSLGVLVALVVAAILAVAAGVVWLRAVSDPGRGRRATVVAAVGVGAALVTALLALGNTGTSFGWASPAGEPVFTRTVVASFPVVALALWVVALAVMVVLVLRRRDGPGEETGGASPA